MRQRLTIRTRIALSILLVVAGCAVWFFSARHQPSAKIRNVVLISIDTCRADHLSCYGFERKTTPNIDAVASQGVLFTRAHSTNPLTLPAHSSMLTGTNPPYHGVHDNGSHRLGDVNVTLAEIMRDHGYQTAAFVSAIVLKAQFGLDQGFGTYDDHVTGEGRKLHINQRKAGDTSRQAVDWLDIHGHEPFFLFLHYFDPHAPYEPPESFALRFPAAPYAGEIAYTDDCIGRVIEKLKSLGIYESTLLVITSDHGEGLGEHEEDTHGYFAYQSTIRIPLIIKAPGGAAQRKLDDPVSIVDVVPMVLDLVGITQPPHIQGENLSLSLVDQGESPQRYLYCESLHPTKYGCNGLFGLIHDRWKYIWTTHPELYDLLRDPAETTNLVDSEVKIASELQAQLQSMLLQQARTDVADSTQKPDRESVQRLMSLGYIGGEVQATLLDVDPKGEDPKESLDHHNRLLKSRALFSSGRLEEARLECLKILEKRPRDLWTLQTLGDIALEAGHNADAVSRFSQYLEAAAEAIDSSSQRTVLQMNSEIASTHNNLGISLHSLGSTAEAEAHFKEALRIDPGYAEPHFNLAIALQGRGRAEEAVVHYQQALRLDPDYADAHNNLGKALENMGRVEEAVAHYQEAVRIKPDFVEVYLNWSTALLRLGRHAEAVKNYQEAVRIKPNFAEAHHAWGNALQGSGRVADAVKHYQEAVRIKPDFGEAHYNWAGALQRLGQFEDAVKHYEEATRLNPEDAEGHYNWGNALQFLRRFEEAVGHYQEALRIKPTFADAHNNLGKAYENLAQFDKAAAEYKGALQLQSGNIAAMNNLASLLATCSDDTVRDGPQAVKLAEQAVRLTGHKNAAILVTLSAAYAEAGNFAQAVAWQEKAIRQVPDNQKERLRRRLELYKQGKPYREKPKY